MWLAILTPFSLDELEQVNKQASFLIIPVYATELNHINQESSLFYLNSIDSTGKSKWRFMRWQNGVLNECSSIYRILHWYLHLEFLWCKRNNDADREKTKFPNLFFLSMKKACNGVYLKWCWIVDIFSLSNFKYIAFMLIGLHASKDPQRNFKFSTALCKQFKTAFTAMKSCVKLLFHKKCYEIN